MTHTDDAGQPLRWEVQEGRQAITASDDHSVLGLFKTGYQAHQYEQWLLRNVATLLDDDLIISSAGLLRGRAVAWVEISVPDTITSPEGVTFRPNLLACTSFDGSLATTYKRTIQNTVCDNTMAVALEEKGQTVKIRHSSKSLTRVADVREALALVHTAADTFQAQVAALTSQAVTDAQFQQIVEALVPIAPDATPRAVTMAKNKRGALNRMYRWDPRAAGFHGTAYGVLQAVNTWHHHEQGGLSGKTSEQKRQARADRNALRAVTGEIEALDNQVHRAIQKVLTGA
jgi:phage/plasmid-like protein (TIGR03299 family)